MPHEHLHHRANSDRTALWLALAANAVFTVVEVVGGVLTGSLALLADAGHMLTDVAALALALFALWFAQRPADPKRTFGYLRAETLAALVNAATLLLICGCISYEAYRRFGKPVPVASLPMLLIAVVGLIVNLGSALVLRHASEENLNIRGAFLHMVADTLGSVGAIAAAVVIWNTGWTRADPLASVLISMLILVGAWRLLSESVHVLMQGTPARINLEAIERSMRRVDGVIEVHDLHVWTVGVGADVMTGHVVLAGDVDQERSHAILIELSHCMREHFGIGHTTIQLEYQNLCLQVKSPILQGD